MSTLLIVIMKRCVLIDASNPLNVTSRQVLRSAQSGWLNLEVGGKRRHRSHVT